MFFVETDDYDAARRALGRIEEAERTSDIERETPEKNSRKGRKRLFNDELSYPNFSPSQSIPEPPELNKRKFNF